MTAERHRSARAPDEVSHDLANAAIIDDPRRVHQQPAHPRDMWLHLSDLGGGEAIDRNFVPSSTLDKLLHALQLERIGGDEQLAADFIRNAVCVAKLLCRTRPAAA